MQRWEAKEPWASTIFSGGTPAARSRLWEINRRLTLGGLGDVRVDILGEAF